MHRQRGFSLLEVLVAFAILAISLGVIMRIFSDAMNHAGLAREQTRATEIAQSLIVDSDRLPTEGAERTGLTEDGFHWSVTISPFEDPDATAGGPKSSLDLWQIAVQVSWGDDRRGPGRSVRLVTLRTRPRPLS